MSIGSSDNFFALACSIFVFTGILRLCHSCSIDPHFEIAMAVDREVLVPVRSANPDDVATVQILLIFCGAGLVLTLVQLHSLFAHLHDGLPISALRWSHQTMALCAYDSINYPPPLKRQGGCWGGQSRQTRCARNARARRIRRRECHSELPGNCMNTIAGVAVASDPAASARTVTAEGFATPDGRRNA